MELIAQPPFIDETMTPIELSTAKEMIARYAAMRKKLIDEVYSLNDTQSLWIAIDKFSAFINNLPAFASGVRVHLAAYSDSDPYPNQTTVILTGTMNDEDQHIDILGKSHWLIYDDPIMWPLNKSQPCPPFCTLSAPTHETMAPIELQVAKAMVARYAATRKKLIDDIQNINDTLSVWLSIEDLKSFTNNLPGYASGVRIHLAVHDHSNKHTPGQTTIILTGTIENGYREIDVVGQGHESINTLSSMAPFNGSAGHSTTCC
jgi:hypothetical protein